MHMKLYELCKQKIIRPKLCTDYDNFYILNINCFKTD